MSVTIEDKGTLQGPTPVERSDTHPVKIQHPDDWVNCLIESVGPQPSSEGRRKTVIDFVRDLIVAGFLARKVP
jgi:hypothetical protein